MPPNIGGVANVGRFYLPPTRPRPYTLTGVTRDLAGNPFANCTVNVFEWGSGLFRASTVSDANGAYTVEVDDPATGLQFQAVAVDSTGLKVGVTLAISGT